MTEDIVVVDLQQYFTVLKTHKGPDVRRRGTVAGGLECYRVVCLRLLGGSSDPEKEAGEDIRLTCRPGTLQVPLSCPPSPRSKVLRPLDGQDLFSLPRVGQSRPYRKSTRFGQSRPCPQSVPVLSPERDSGDGTGDMNGTPVPKTPRES